MTEIAAVTSTTADAYAAIRLKSKRAGRPIPANDVRAVALARRRALETLSNDGHFDVVDGIRRIAFRVGPTQSSSPPEEGKRFPRYPEPAALGPLSRA